MLENSYVLGIGKAGIKVSKEIKTESVFISLINLEEIQKIGSDCEGYEATHGTTIYIKNLGGIKSLKKALKVAKKLIKQQKL